MTGLVALGYVLFTAFTFGRGWIRLILECPINLLNVTRGHDELEFSFKESYSNSKTFPRSSTPRPALIIVTSFDPIFMTKIFELLRMLVRYAQANMHLKSW